MLLSGRIPRSIRSKYCLLVQGTLAQLPLSNQVYKQGLMYIACVYSCVHWIVAASFGILYKGPIDVVLCNAQTATC